MNISETIGAVLFVLAWVALVMLPGIAISYVGWKLSRNMRPILAQAIFRAGLMAITTSPSIWGHAGILPAIFLALILQGRDRGAGIGPILIVWVIAFPLLYMRARKHAPVGKA
jgi:hypothetical protein